MIEGVAASGHITINSTIGIFFKGIVHVEGIGPDLGFDVLFFKLLDDSITIVHENTAGLP